MVSKNHQEAFTRSRSIGEFEKGRSSVSVAQQFGIDKSVASRAWKILQISVATVRKISGDWLRKTTARDNRYIVLQAKRYQSQISGNIAQKLHDSYLGLLCTDVCQKVAYSFIILNSKYH
ncbi:hypothetical protein TNCV_3254961 [Trichonephila clavipes]|nr:hypothetical protein TNCV_3254961 [Trichonephila clavipes]